MLAFGLALLSLFIGALNVNAQSSVSIPIPSLSSCIQSCLSQALPLGQCGSITNISCVCTSTPFQTGAASCLSANCSAADQATALTLQSTECAAASLSSGSAAPTSSSGSSGSSTSSSPSTSSGSSSSNSSSNSSGSGTTNTTGGGSGTNSGALSLITSVSSSAFGTLALVASAMFGGVLVLL